MALLGIVVCVEFREDVLDGLKVPILTTFKKENHISSSVT